MTIEVSTEDSLEEIWLELGRLISDQTSRVTEVTRHHKIAINNITDRLFEILGMLKKLQTLSGSSRSAEGSNHQPPYGVKLNFPRFTSTDPEVWLF